MEEDYEKRKETRKLEKINKNCHANGVNKKINYWKNDKKNPIILNEENLKGRQLDVQKNMKNE